MGSFWPTRNNAPPERKVREGIDRRELLWVAAIVFVVNAVTACAFWFNPAGGHRVGMTDFPLDDGWIHMVYARSIATTLRPDFNPGQMETGMTSPSWAILNAALYWPGRLLGMNPTIMPKALSLVFGTLTAILLYLVVRWRSGSLVVASASALLLSIEPQWCFSRASGMEVTTFAFLLLLTFAAIDLRRDLLAGLAMGFATLTRPEGLLLLLTALPLAFVVAIRERKPARTLVKITLPVLVMFGSWAGYNICVTGYPLPNTYYVKATMGSILRQENLAFLFHQMFLGADFMRSPLSPLLFILGVAYLLRSDLPGNIGLLVFPWVFLFALSVTHTFPQAWPYYWSRYFHPAYPFFILPFFFGLMWLESVLQRSRKPVASGFVKRCVPSIVAAVALLAVAWPMTRSFIKWADLYSLNCKNIHDGTVAMGTWLRDHTKPGDWIASADAGAIRYFSERNLVDMMGLNDHRIVHADAITRYGIIDDARPVYFVLPPDLFRESIAYFQLLPVHAVVIYPFTICESTGQSVLVAFSPPPNAHGGR